MTGQQLSARGKALLDDYGRATSARATAGVMAEDARAAARERLEKYVAELEKVRDRLALKPPTGAAGFAPAALREQAAAELDAMDMDQEQALALQLVPMATAILDHARGVLPPGTDFGVFVMAKPVDGQLLGRVIAMTTNRARVAPAVGQWVLSAMEGGA